MKNGFGVVPPKLGFLQEGKSTCFKQFFNLQNFRKILPEKRAAAY